MLLCRFAACCLLLAACHMLHAGFIAIYFCAELFFAASISHTLNSLLYVYPLAIHGRLVQLLWPLQRFKDSRGQHLLQREALNYGLDLEPPSPPQRYEQDEPARVLTKELHTEAGRILAVPSQHLQQPTEQEEDNVPPHMPHARWETATTMTLPTSTASSNLASSADIVGASNRYSYSWQVGEWSKCSQECGAAGSGLQVST